MSAIATTMHLVIGTRGSALALWQATWVKDRLAAAGHEVSIKRIKTSGDKLPHVSLSQSGIKGLFIKEIEEALLEGSIDLAVHSLKDLPIGQPPGLHVAVVSEREDARDAWICRDGLALTALPSGSRVGTSSLRRQSQLRALCPDLEVVPLRGNLDTRIRKLDSGEVEALVVAAAGVHRLGLDGRVTAYFDVNEMCPAVGQGALAIEVRRGDEKIENAVRPLEHSPTRQAVRAEWATLRHLGGGCEVPIAAHAVIQDDGLHLRAVVASPDGGKIIRAAAAGSVDSPEALGTLVAEDLMRQGAKAILESVHR